MGCTSSSSAAIEGPSSEWSSQAQKLRQDVTGKVCVTALDFIRSPHYSHSFQNLDARPEQPDEVPKQNPPEHETGNLSKKDTVDANLIVTASSGKFSVDPRSNNEPSPEVTETVSRDLSASPSKETEEKTSNGSASKATTEMVEVANVDRAQVTEESTDVNEQKTSSGTIVSDADASGGKTTGSIADTDPSGDTSSRAKSVPNAAKESPENATLEQNEILEAAPKESKVENDGESAADVKTSETEDAKTHHDVSGDRFSAACLPAKSDTPVNEAENGKDASTSKEKSAVKAFIQKIELENNQQTKGTVVESDSETSTVKFESSETPHASKTETNTQNEEEEVPSGFEAEIQTGASKNQINETSAEREGKEEVATMVDDGDLKADLASEADQTFEDNVNKIESSDATDTIDVKGPNGVAEGKLQNEADAECNDSSDKLKDGEDEVIVDSEGSKEEATAINLSLETKQVQNFPSEEALVHEKVDIHSVTEHDEMVVEAPTEESQESGTEPVQNVVASIEATAEECHDEEFDAEAAQAIDETPAEESRDEELEIEPATPEFEQKMIVDETVKAHAGESHYGEDNADAHEAKVFDEPVEASLNVSHDELATSSVDKDPVLDVSPNESVEATSNDAVVHSRRSEDNDAGKLTNKFDENSVETDNNKEASEAASKQEAEPNLTAETPSTTGNPTNGDASIPKKKKKKRKNRKRRKKKKSGTSPVSEDVENVDEDDDDGQSDSSDDQRLRISELLNVDPWSCDNAEAKAGFSELDILIGENPKLCAETYKLDSFNESVYPLSALCSIGAPLELVTKCIDAYEEALSEKDPWIGNPLHYACAYKASLPIVEAIVNKRPACLAEVNEFKRLPLHM